MRLKKVEFTNWGRHEHLLLDFDGPVAGILGPNGSGKSTLMTGIRFGVTGELPKNERADSFVRNWGMPDGPSNGSVKIWFDHDGVPGSILRRVGKSPLTELEREPYVGDKRLKKVGPIDIIMRDILGADKKAIAAAVFIAQSELDSLLFGGQTEREELFLQILNLSHMGRASDAAEQSIALLAKDLVDTTALRDSLVSQQNNLATELAELNKLPIFDYSEDLVTLHNWSTNLGTYDRSSASVLQLTEELNTKRAAMRDWLVKQGFADGIPYETAVTELEARIKILEEKLQADNSRLSGVKALMDAKTSHTGWTAEKATAESLVEEAKLAIARVPGFSSEHYQTLMQDIQRIPQKKQLQTDISNATEVVTTMAPELKEVTDLCTKGANLQALSTLRVGDLEHQITQLQPQMNLLQRLQTMTGTECPTCGSTVTADTIRVLEESGVAKRYQDLTLDLANEKAGLENIKKDGKLNSDRYEFLQRTIQEASRIMAEGPGKLAGIVITNDKPVEELQAELAGIERSRQEHATASNALSSAQTRLTTADAQLLMFTPEQLSGMTTVTLEEFQSLNASIQQENLELQTKRSLLSRTVAATGALSEVSGRINEASSQQAASAEAMRLMEQNFTPTVRNTMTAEGGNVAGAINTLQLQQDAQHKQAGQRSAVDRQLNDIDLRIKQLEQQDKMNQGKRLIITELEQIKQAFRRQGIPNAFIRDRFDLLTGLTKINLATHEANFTVEADPEKNVSFTFQRVDDITGYVMGQEKLSGGQRVRLAIAFLLSVQQLVIPEVGLLSLDEPSVHLDEQGVEQLRELLDNLGRTLQNSGSQVIVCDHDVRLQEAFKPVAARL